MGKKFGVKDLPERANQLSPKLHDVNVELQRVKKYFESSAWDVLQALITEKEQFPNWLCSTCQEDLHDFESIQCDSCLNWHHLKCVSLKTAPKKNAGIAHDAMRYVDVNILLMYYVVDCNVLFILLNLTIIHIHVSACFWRMVLTTRSIV